MQARNVKEMGPSLVDAGKQMRERLLWHGSNRIEVYKTAMLHAQLVTLWGCNISGPSWRVYGESHSISHSSLPLAL